MRKMTFFGIMLVLLSNNAFAYIDPGTGSIIAGSLWPMIVAFFSAVLAFFVKWFWRPIKKFFMRLKGSAIKEK